MHLIGQRKNSGILIGQRKQHANGDRRPDWFNGSVRNASDWSADKVRDWLGRKSWAIMYLRLFTEQVFHWKIDQEPREKG